MRGGLKLHQLDKNFEANGIYVSARLVGYQYYREPTRTGQSGDRPLLAYTANDGIQRTYLATEMGAIDSARKLTLPKSPITIVYLPSDPRICRVKDWYHSDFKLAIFVGIISLFVGLSSTRTFFHMINTVRSNKQNRWSSV